MNWEIQLARPLRPVLDAAQGKRDQRDDDQRIEDDRGQDGALRRLQVHDVDDVEALKSMSDTQINVMLLIAGLLCVFIGTMPIVSTDGSMK